MDTARITTRCHMQPTIKIRHLQCTQICFTTVYLPPKTLRLLYVTSNDQYSRNDALFFSSISAQHASDSRFRPVLNVSGPFVPYTTGPHLVVRKRLQSKNYCGTSTQF